MPTVDLSRLPRKFAKLYRPLERYRVGAELRLLPHSERMKLLEKLKMAFEAQRSTDDSSKRRSERTRKEAIDDVTDPLLIVVRDLGINRFITTNYDREIQRMLDEQGLWVAPAGPTGAHSSRSIQKDPLSPSYREVVFSHRDHGELIALASRERSRGAWVVHLHGRSDRSSGASIIATERDYQERYERNDERRPLLDDATRLAFGSSPILFLGIGMNEMDLLRPLRQFMSSPSRIGERIAVALLPMLESADSCEQQKIKLLQQYGVYALHFGRKLLVSKTGSPPPKNEPTDPDTPDWLPTIKKLQSLILKIFKIYETPDEIRKLLNRTKDDDFLTEITNDLKNTRQQSKTTGQTSKNTRQPSNVSMKVLMKIGAS